MLFRTTCWYCGNKLLGRTKRHPERNRTSLDHQQPKSKGGNWAGNTVMSCVVCNHDKAELTLEEYRLLVMFRAGKVKMPVDKMLFYGERFD